MLYKCYLKNVAKENKQNQNQVTSSSDENRDLSRTKYPVKIYPVYKTSLHIISSSYVNI